MKGLSSQSGSLFLAFAPTSAVFLSVAQENMAVGFVLAMGHTMMQVVGSERALLRLTWKSPRTSLLMIQTS